MNLDDASELVAADPGGMHLQVADLPRQVAQADARRAQVRAAVAALGERARHAAELVVCGMGGSAFGGDYAAVWAAPHGARVHVHRGYGVPPWCGAATLFVFSSYSGDTEETLDAFAAAPAASVVETVFAGLREGRGGTLVTPNLDILQLCSERAETAALFNGASLAEADGMPLLWLAHLAGRPLPARVAGSDLVWLLAERAAREGRSIFLLGGEQDVAPLARLALERRYPGLRVAGVASPPVSFPPTAQQLEGVRQMLTAAAPDLAYCAFGAPKQEQLPAELTREFPRTWFVGCGGALSFIAGHRRRAPPLMQRLGLEWLHRMLDEPGRLTRRYLLRNLPYLFTRAAPCAVHQRLGGRS